MLDKNLITPRVLCEYRHIEHHSITRSKGITRDPEITERLQRLDSWRSIDHALIRTSAIIFSSGAYFRIHR